jgi:hypothetical protein
MRTRERPQVLLLDPGGARRGGDVAAPAREDLGEVSTFELLEQRGAGVRVRQVTSHDEPRRGRDVDRLHLGLDPERRAGDEQRRADLKPDLGDPRALEPGAVARAEIAELEAPFVCPDRGVTTRDAIIVEHEVTVDVRADHDIAGADLARASALGALEDDQLSEHLALHVTHHGFMVSRGEGDVPVSCDEGSAVSGMASSLRDRVRVIHRGVLDGLATVDAAVLAELEAVANREVVRMTHERARWEGMIGVHVRDGAIVAITARLCELRAIPASIATLPRLERLDLSGNQLTHLPELGSAVRELYAYDNQLVALPALPPMLRMLDISDNALTVLSIDELTELEVLYVARNKLTALALPPGLAYVNADANRLDVFPAIEQLARLVELRLIANRISELPAALARVPLRELYLRGNGLGALPDSIGALADLELLDLRDNVLTTLPDALGGLGKLRDLDLRTNHLDTLPACILDLPLRKLDVRWNPWRNPPSWLPQMRERGCLVYT